MPEAPNLIELFTDPLLYIQGGVWLTVVIVAAVNYRAFPKHWRRGMLVGIAICVMLLPHAVLSAMYFDPSAAFDGQMNEMARGVSRFTSFLQVPTVVAKIAWWMALYVAAAGVWHRILPAPLPLLERRGKVPWATIIGTGIFGLAAGVVSLVVFHYLGVDDSDVVKLQMQFYPGVMDTPGAVRGPIFILLFMGIAIVEELTYRGVLLGVGLRLTGRDTAGGVIMGVVVALIWAVLHWHNTNQPVVKIVQILIVGVVLGEVARRRGLEAAIAGHVGLNIAAGTMAFN